MPGILIQNHFIFEIVNSFPGRCICYRSNLFGGTESLLWIFFTVHTF